MQCCKHLHTHANTHMHTYRQLTTQDCRQLTPCTSTSLHPPCQTNTASGFQRRHFFGRCNCNWRFRNEFICQKILSVDLQGVHCFLNTSCHCAAFPCGVVRRRRACRDTGRLQILSPLPSRIRLHPFFNLAYWETSQHSQWSLYDLCQLSARGRIFSSSLCALMNRQQANFYHLD